MKRIGLIGALAFALLGSSALASPPIIGPPISSAAAESCHVLAAAPANLLSVSGYAGQAEFILVFNAVTAPSDGAVVPTVWAYVPAAGSWSINYGGPSAAYFGTGVVVCASSTGPFTKTAIATNNAFSGMVQ